MKALTFLGFALLFMWLGSLITNTIEESVEQISGEKETLLATTQSVVDNSFVLPGVYIMMPGIDQSNSLVSYACYMQDDVKK